MLKLIKKIALSALSVLGISFLVWTFALLNPQWSYANKTQFDKVTVYHNQPLEKHTQGVVEEAIAIIQSSDLYRADIAIELCFNDDMIYPNLNPLVRGGMAYALFNKTVLKDCTPQFQNNIASTQWAVNQNELRKFDLTWLLAHEFTHNLQYKTNATYAITSTLGSINWKLEGHAEYVARQFKNDGKLREKISRLLEEQTKEQKGLPVFEWEDGTKQILSYFKYALVVQYLLEQENKTFEQLCEDERNLEAMYTKMMEWYQNE